MRLTRPAAALRRIARLCRAAGCAAGLGISLAAGLGACVSAPGPPPVAHRVTAGFWHDPPACVVILPAAVRGEISARSAERALARHLSGRVAGVIGPDARDRLTRHWALDLTSEPAADPAPFLAAVEHPWQKNRRTNSPSAARKRFAERAGCPHGLALTLRSARHFALVWSEARIDLRARLIDLCTGDALWQADHRVSRGDGGLPTSPVGVALAVGRAGLFVAGPDLLASVLDDGLRALMATLPDTRTYSAAPPSGVPPVRIP